MIFVDSLLSTNQGIEWLNVLGPEALRDLINTETILINNFDIDSIVPKLNMVMLPFHLLPYPRAKILVICKAPYLNFMATGVPVEVNGDLDPPSARIFRDAISPYYDKLDTKMFMRCYYDLGMLVINASFTGIYGTDKDYVITDSHHPLWLRFLMHLIHLFNNDGKIILGLGSESRTLLNNITPTNNNIHKCPFPTEQDASTIFTSKIRELIEDYLLDVNTKLHG